MTAQPVESFLDSPIAPALQCFAITPDDTSDLANVTKAVYVGEEGDIVLRAARDNQDVTFRNVPAGFILDVRVSAVRSTGTTAGSLVGLA